MTIRTAAGYGLLGLCALLLCGGLVSCKKRADTVTHEDQMTKPIVQDPATGAKYDIESQGEMPADWPVDALPGYSAAENLTALGKGEGQSAGSGLQFSSADSQEQVQQFYADKAAAAGYKLASSTRLPDNFVNTYQDGRQMFSVSTSTVDARTQAVLRLEPASGQAPERATYSWYNPTQMPDGYPGEVLPVYPEAKVGMVESGPQKTLLLISTNDSEEQVLAYYAVALARQGYTETQRQAMAGTTSLEYAAGASVVRILTGPTDPAAAAQDGALSVSLELTDSAAAGAEGGATP